jgi:hypothetical protein
LRGNHDASSGYLAATVTPSAPSSWYRSRLTVTLCIVVGSSSSSPRLPFAASSSRPHVVSTPASLASRGSSLTAASWAESSSSSDAYTSGTGAVVTVVVAVVGAASVVGTSVEESSDPLEHAATSSTVATRVAVRRGARVTKIDRRTEMRGNREVSGLRRRCYTATA